jgi:hypothetical protein
MCVVTYSLFCQVRHKLGRDGLEHAFAMLVQTLAGVSLQNNTMAYAEDN